MNLEDFVQLTSFARQFKDILNVAWVVHHIFHQLEQLCPCQLFASARDISDGFIHAVRNSTNAGAKLIGRLHDIGIVVAHGFLGRVQLFL